MAWMAPVLPRTNSILASFSRAIWYTFKRVSLSGSLNIELTADLTDEFAMLVLGRGAATGRKPAEFFSMRDNNLVNAPLVLATVYSVSEYGTFTVMLMSLSPTRANASSNAALLDLSFNVTIRPPALEPCSRRNAISPSTLPMMLICSNKRLRDDGNEPFGRNGKLKFTVSLPLSTRPSMVIVPKPSFGANAMAS